MRFLVTLGLLVLLAFGARAGPEVAPDGVWEAPPGRWLRILHLNDVHGHAHPRIFAGEALPAEYLGREIGGLFSAAEYVARLRRRALRADPGWARRYLATGDDGVLFLDGGDWFGGTLYDSATRGGAVARVLADPALDLDATVVGNHAWDFEARGFEDFLATMPPRIAVLGRNVGREGGGWSGVREAVVLDQGGVRVGVLGALTGHALHQSLPSKTRGVEVTDPLVGLGAALRDLRARADVVVLLLHVGLERDGETRAALEELLAREPDARPDLIVDGHSHRDHTGRLADGTPFVQADHFATRLGEVLIELGDGGVPTGRIHARRVILDAATLPPPPRMVARHSADIAGRARLEDEPVAWTTPGFAARALPRSEPRLVSDCGDLVARAFLETLKGIDPEVVVGVMNQGGVRQGLYAPTGSITRAAVHSVLPFGNIMSVMTISGAALTRLVERGIQHRSRMSFAGLEIEAEERPGPEGEPPVRTLTRLALRLEGGGLAPVLPAARYRVATSEYLAAQGFRDEPPGTVDRRDLAMTDVDAVVAWLEEVARGGPLDAARLAALLAPRVRVARQPGA